MKLKPEDSKSFASGLVRAAFPRRLFAASAILAMADAGTIPALQAADHNEFIEFNLDTHNDGNPEIHGRLFEPLNYDVNQSYPLVIFYHGGGQTGYDNEIQVNQHIDNLFANAKTRNFFLYAPQARSSWAPLTISQTIEKIGDAILKYPIDPSRIYVTGLSMGGGGSWSAHSVLPEIFAASVPICGVTGGQFSAQALAGKHIWAYHARNDGEVNVSATRNRVDALRSVFGKPKLTYPLSSGAPYYTDGSTFYEEDNLRYSEYSAGNHGIWGRVYNENALYQWLLGKTQTVTTLEEGETLLYDFGGARFAGVDSQGRIWNTTRNVQKTFDTSIEPFARTSAGRRTFVIMQLTDKFVNTDTAGLTAGSIYDSEISKDQWLTSGTDTRGALAIWGLQPGGQYRLTFFASSTNNDGGRGRVTRYQAGGQWADLNVVNNLSNTVSLEVAADADGIIDIEVIPAPGTGSRYGQIGALEVTRLADESGTGRLTWGNGGTPGTGDPWSILASGTTRIQFEDYDQGGEGLAFHDDSNKYGTTSFRPGENVDVQSTTDTGGGMNVGWAAANEWLNYSIDVPSTGSYTLRIRSATTSSNSRIRALAGTDVNNLVNLAGDIALPNTGGNQTWATTSVNVQLAAGVQTLQFFIVAGSNLNWFELVKN